MQNGLQENTFKKAKNKSTSIGQKGLKRIFQGSYKICCNDK